MINQESELLFKTIENLICGGAFDDFNETRNTFLNNIKNAIIYAELVSGLDSSLVSTPVLERSEELDSSILMNKEYELYGFYVSNHPASKYNGIKLNDIENHFNKNIVIYGLLEKVNTIHTKKGDTMAFLKISDETGSLDCTLFPNRINYINKIKNGDLLKIDRKSVV